MKNNPSTFHIRKPCTMEGVILQKAFYREPPGARHVHEDYSINLIRKGAMEAFVKGTSKKISPATLLCINPDEAHAYRSLSPEGYYHDSLFIDPETLRACVGDSRSYYFSESEVPSMELISRFTHLVDGIAQEGLESLEFECLLYAFLDSLLSHQGVPLEGEGKNVPEEIIFKAKEFINGHYNQQIDLDDISSYLGLSKYHFQRIFKKATSISVHQYLLSCRLEKSKQAIRQGRSLIQTAYDCGFYDQSHFNRCFKTFTGITPGNYQKFFT